MSHTATVKLDRMFGSTESVIRAMTDMGIKREHVEVSNEFRVDLRMWDNTKAKANIVVRREHAGGYGDLGFEHHEDGSWSMHCDNMSPYHKDDWKKKFMSRFAVQKIGYEAESQGRTWNEQTVERDGKQYVHVRVNDSGGH